MFKALRNFVHPLMQSYSSYADRRPAAVEAFGDMLMYLAGLGRLPDVQPGDEYEDASEAVAGMAAAFAVVLMHRSECTLAAA